MKRCTVMLLVLTLTCSTSALAQYRRPTYSSGSAKAKATQKSSTKAKTGLLSKLFPKKSSSKKNTTTAASQKKTTTVATRKKSTAAPQRKSIASLFGFGKKSNTQKPTPAKATQSVRTYASTTKGKPSYGKPSSSKSVRFKQQKLAMQKKKTKPAGSSNRVTLASKLKAAFTPVKWGSKVSTPPAAQKKKNGVVLTASNGQSNEKVQHSYAQSRHSQTSATTAQKTTQVAKKTPAKKTSLFSRVFRRNSQPKKPARLPNLYSHKDPGPPKASKRAQATATQSATTARLTPVPEYDTSEFSEFVVVKKRNATQTVSATMPAEPKPAPPAAGKWDIDDPFENTGLANSDLKVVPPSSFNAVVPVPPADDYGPATIVKKTPAKTVSRATAVAAQKATPATKTVTWQTAPFPADRRKLTRTDKIRLVSLRKGMTGLKGFCAVELIDNQDLLDTRPEFESRFGLTTYYFSSAAARQKFESNPTRYIPAAGGMDVITLAKTDDEVKGSLDHSAWYKGRLYLFASKANQKQFQSNPRRYSATH